MRKVKLKVLKFLQPQGELGLDTKPWISKGIALDYQFAYRGSKEEEREKGGRGGRKKEGRREETVIEGGR